MLVPDEDWGQAALAHHDAASWASAARVSQYETRISGWMLSGVEKSRPCRLRQDRRRGRGAQSHSRTVEDARRSTTGRRDRGVRGMDARFRLRAERPDRPAPVRWLRLPDRIERTSEIAPSGRDRPRLPRRVVESPVRRHGRPPRAAERECLGRWAGSARSSKAWSGARLAAHRREGCPRPSSLDLRPAQQRLGDLLVVTPLFEAPCGAAFPTPRSSPASASGARRSCRAIPT